MADLVDTAETTGGWSAAFAGMKWQPNRDTLVALASYGAVVAALYIAFQVFTTANVAGNFVTFGIIALALLGVGLPIAYTVFISRRPISDLGLTLHFLVPSLALGLLLGADTWRATMETLPSGDWSASLVPLVAMTLSVGLFEAVFFRGWLQLRFEAAFGLIPGLILAALCYSLYHVGYGMTAGEMIFLFGYGLVFGAVFRLTRNVFVLWPFYTPVGSLYSNIRDGLALPSEATYGFLIVLALMAAAIAAGVLLRRMAAVSGSPTATARRT